MPGRLSDDEITRALAGLPGWAREGDEIRKQFSFPDFRGSMAFVNGVADLAEAANHHPDITINYNRVTLALSSHDAGGLTDRDVDLAERIERQAGEG
jgi:4a-hydroxytetrahydrobiopterin dehydratase